MFEPNPDYQPGDDELTRYLNSYDDNYIFRFGGSGYDYVIVACPLSYLGLSAGQTVTTMTKCEGTSELYNDVSYDVIGVIGDHDQGRVEITLGENEEIPY